ncbi:MULTISPECIES: ABC transporter permease [unclassified Beijerinckia]|uniref:ABC transporter permease n=1 Tax=unclassified Beijerinckia TaxID=2638183 RepID=UPI00089B0F12|nr:MULTISPECIES: ABC transporter permease [unclassified Beijerinckia]MDH7794055.1 ABC-type nitrate/sulfonate/bicarbonate transport system permease component [Beijerinckia sp. GAS462]SEB52292.1 NitT/TauT family transport system permease protein [Beijerinckia sp. 28-YEA-48]
MPRQWRQTSVGLIIPAVLLLIWQGAGWFDWLPAYLPPPSIILTETWHMLVSGELFYHSYASLKRALSGYVLGASVGVLTGLAAATLRPVEGFVEPLVSLTYPIPKIAALPMVFAWFGLGDLSKIVIISTSIFYPVYIAALAGGRSTTKTWIWAARNMGASPTTIIRRVVLPAALPSIFNGLRIGLALSFVVMFVAELVASSEGLGYLVVFAEQGMRFDLVYVAVLAISIIGFTADRLLLLARRHIVVGQELGTEARR